MISAHHRNYTKDTVRMGEEVPSSSEKKPPAERAEVELLSDQILSSNLSYAISAGITSPY